MFHEALDETEADGVTPADANTFMHDEALDGVEAGG